MQTVSERKRDSYHVGNLAPLMLSEARSLLAEVGPHKLSIRALSDRVGVSATAAYHHFANKNELMCHLGAQGFRELALALKQRPEQATSLEKLRQGSLAYFEFALKNPALYQLMFGPEIRAEDMTPEFKQNRKEAFGELKQIISEVLQQPIDSAEVFSSALASWSFTHGLAALVIHGVLPHPHDDPAQLVNKAMQGFKNLFDRQVTGHS